jgi:hypothetical protein
MKPRIDISAQNSLTIWESGAWNSTQGVGRSTLISGPEGERLNVIFDTNPEFSNFHYLFFARVGQMVATVFVRKLPNRPDVPDFLQRTQPNVGETYRYELELNRIQTLSTEQVQGNAVPRAQMESLWVHQEVGPRNAEELIYKNYKSDRIGYKDVYRDLMVQAVEKAFTLAENQKLFWGIPRPVRETV